MHKCHQVLYIVTVYFSIFSFLKPKRTHTDAPGKRHLCHFNVKLFWMIFQIVCLCSPIFHGMRWMQIETSTILSKSSNIILNYCHFKFLATYGNKHKSHEFNQQKHHHHHHDRRHHHHADHHCFTMNNFFVKSNAFYHRHSIQFNFLFCMPLFLFLEKKKIK